MLSEPKNASTILKKQTRPLNLEPKQYVFIFYDAI